MSGVEVIAFIIGLEPLLVRGVELIDRIRTYQVNKSTAPTLRASFTTFATDLKTSISHLVSSSEALPEQSRDIIAADVTLLQNALSAAQSLTERVTKRLSSNRVAQFLRAKAQAQDCDCLAESLEKAKSLVQNANKYLDIITTLHHISENVQEKLVDCFTPCFPPSNKSCLDVVLDFDNIDEDGNPGTAEARIKKCVLEMVTSTRKVAAIHGGAGVGKSTILESLSFEEDIRQVFPDGVYVIKLGMDATKVTISQALCRILRESGAQKTESILRADSSFDEALKVFINFFQNRRCAFFVDDVWSGKVGIGPISKLCDAARGNESITVVMTTREHAIATLAPKENTFHVVPREPQSKEARRILLLHADCTDQQSEDKAFEKAIERVLSICNGLPVSLAAAGKGVRMVGLSLDCPQVVVWGKYVQTLLTYREQLIAEDIGEYGNLLATFAASLSILDERREWLVGGDTKFTFAQMHRRLCVLQKQDRVPSTTLKHLWELESDAHAERIAMRFVEVGLASASSVLIESTWAWRLSMHDSLHDFAVMMARRSGEFEKIHKELLTAYAASDSSDSFGNKDELNWWSHELAPDGYIHQNLCRLLAVPRRDDDVVELLLRPKWTARQLELNGMLSLEADFMLGIKTIQNQNIVSKGRQLEALKLILGAIWLSSGFISRNPLEIWFQLQGRLRLYAQINAVVTEYLHRIEKLESKPRLRSLSSLLLSPGGTTTKIVTADSKIKCLTAGDGEQTICGCSNGQVIILDFEQGCTLTEWQAHKMEVLAVTFLQGRVATGSADQTIKVWDLENLACLMTLEGHTAWVTSVAFAGSGRLVSASIDGTVRLWDLGREALEKTMVSTGLPACVWCVAPLPDNDHIVSGRNDCTIDLWKLSSGSQVRVMEMHEAWVTCVAVTPDGQDMVTGSHDGTLRRIHMETGELLGEPLSGSRRSVCSIALNRDASLVASGAHDQTIRVWDMKTGKPVCEPLVGHGDWVTGVIFLGDKVVSCSLDRTIRMWDIEKANEPVLTEHHEFKTTAVCFSPDMKRAISGSLDSTVRIWDTSTGALLGKPLKGHQGKVEDVKMMNDGRILSVGRDNTVRVWDHEKMELISVLEGHEKSVTCIGILKNAQVITGSLDNCVRLWDLQSGTSEIIFRNKAMISSLYITDDNLRVILAPLGDEIQVLDLETKTISRELHVKDAWMLGRGEIMDLLEEANDELKVRMTRGSREIRFDEKVIGSLESNVRDWDVRGSRICVGLEDGQVGFLELLEE